MKLSLALVESKIVATLRSQAGVRRHILPMESERVDLIAMKMLALLERGVREETAFKNVEREMHLLGGQLASLLLPREVIALLKGGEGTLELELDGALFIWPWELLSLGGQFLALRYDLARRLVEHEQPSKGRAFLKKARALIIVSNPDGDLPGAASEGEAILEVIERELHYPVRLVVNPEVSEVQHYLGEYDFVHYVGHTVATDDGSPAWKFKDGLLSAHHIRGLSDSMTMPFFLYSSACPGTPGGGVSWEHQLYSAFIKGGTRHYIGTHWDLPDKLGQTFALDFYTLLGRAGMGSALRGARRGSLQRDRGILWSLYFYCGDPGFSLVDTVAGDEPTRLGPRGDVPWKNPRAPKPALPTAVTGFRTKSGRVWRISGALMIIASVAIPSVYLTHRAIRQRRDKIEVVIKKPFDVNQVRKIAFRGFGTPAKGLESAALRMERCFIRHMTYLRGVAVIDSRGSVVPEGVMLELSGKIVTDQEGPKILLVIHKKADRAILYLDEISLFSTGEEHCIKLTEWLRRKLLL